ncbi:MAG TPA: murein L,D-transpeptidase catalytic domain family protein, partial [Niastella sp.]
RSQGCPALPQQETGRVIQTIKDGSCLFIYHPTKNYIQKSRVLNS